MLQLKWTFLFECFKWVFSISTPVFSVTWSFRNLSNMLIWCSKNFFFYNQWWKVVLVNIFWKHLNGTVDLLAVQDLYSIHKFRVFGWCLSLNRSLSQTFTAVKGWRCKRGGGGGFGYQKSKNFHKAKIFKHVNKRKGDGRQFSRWE